MCLGPLQGVVGAEAVQRRTNRNDAPVITGRQTGVEAPIDTSKATARLKKRREGDPAKKAKAIAKGRGRSPLDLKII